MKKYETTPPVAQVSEQEIAQEKETVLSSEKKYQRRIEEMEKTGFNPIMVCVGHERGLADIMEVGPDEHVEFEDIDLPNESIQNVTEGSLHSGEETYVISDISSTDKASFELYDCTGIIAVGVDKETGENISFLSHQTPESLLYDDETIIEKFKRDLKNRLSQLNDRSKPNSIDIVVFGGNFLPPTANISVTKTERDYIGNYKKSIRLISGIVEGELNFEPLVIVGPKKNLGEDSVFLKTDKRRMYLNRNREKTNIESFLPSQLDEVGSEW